MDPAQVHPPDKSTTAVREIPRVIPERANLPRRVAARLIWALVNGLGMTLRWRLNISPPARAAIDAGPVIFVVWHNRLALCLLIYRQLTGRQPNRRMAAMVSASRDGGMLAHALELFQIHPIRGSSSRRGPQALRELVTSGRQGLDLAITPDGPRGPRYVVQPGVIAAAQLTGFPIIPVGYRLSWKRVLKSWDRFQIPLPFSRCEVEVGDPIRAARENSIDTSESVRTRLQSILLELSRDT